MEIQWITMDRAAPSEGKKVYITDSDGFVAQAYYHIGMYWQDANTSQRYPLAKINQWCEIEAAQAVTDALTEKYQCDRRNFATNQLEKVAEEYAEKHLALNEYRQALAAAFIDGYAAAVHTLTTFQNNQIDINE